MAMNPRLLVPRASYDPRRIDGLEGWWDAADASTLTLDSGRVATLADKSGNERHAVNSTSGSTQPDYVIAGQNGRNTVRFASASSQFLEAGEVGDWNFLHDGTKSFLFTVAKYFDSANPNAIGPFATTGGGGSTQIGFGYWYDDRASVSRNNALSVSINSGVSGTNVVGVSTNDKITPNAYVLLEILVDAGNVTADARLQVRVNGGAPFGGNTSTVAPSTSNSSYPLAFGRLQAAAPAFYFTGDLCEVIAYSQHPTTAFQLATRQYLAKKWGVTLA